MNIIIKANKPMQNYKRKNQKIKRLMLTAGLVSSMLMLMLMQTNTASADQITPVWDSWSALSGGYLGRRKISENLNKDVTERRQQEVVERLDRAIILQNRAKAKAKASGDSKKVAKLEQSISGLELQNSSQNLKVKTPAEPSSALSALWLRTLAEGLTSVSVTELANITGSQQNEIRKLATSGKLTLTNDDQAVSWLYYPDTDSVLFVSEIYDTFYADQNAYHLSFDKTANSDRFDISKSRKSPTGGLATPFNESLKFEEEGDRWRLTWVVKEEMDADYWYWDYLYAGFKDSMDIPLNIPNPATEGTVQVKITLRGSTNLYDGNDHNVFAELNGVPIGSMVTWDAFEEAVLVVDFDQELLQADGNNLLVLKTQYEAGTHPIEWLDQVEVDYSRNPVAQDGQLWLHSVAAGTQIVTGFSSEELLVIQNPINQPTAKRDISIYQQADGSFAVSFEVKKAGEDYLVSEVGSVASTFIEEDIPSDLAQNSNSVDYLIIAHRAFSETAKQLKNYRENDFGDVKIAWMDDIYDEFSAGREDPFATTRFLELVTNEWQKSPSMVVIVGKGTIDQKDRLGYSDNFVSGVMTATPWALYTSDDRLLGGAAGATFATGRIPITSDEQGLAYLAKVQMYDNQGTNPEKFNAVLVADNADAAGDFHANADLLADRLLNEFGFDQVVKNYHPQTPSVSSQMLLDSTWEAGLISYDGHGSIAQVGDGSERFIVASNAINLVNTNLPVFVALTCAAGEFSYPGVRSLAGTLVLDAVGGSIAAIAPTGLSLDFDAQVLGNAFFDSLYGSGNRLGTALADAKTNTKGLIYDFMPRIYQNIGDPAVYAR